MELYGEPREIIFKKIAPYEDEPEMTEFESGFLCGLIKERKPSKIVEIGVAAGGTTSIILQCLDMLQMNESCEFYSLDYSKEFYRDASKQTGFMAEEAKRYLNKEVRHKFMLGGVAPQFLDEIRGGIDFVILDTMHYLPGEILDFLAILPYLTPDAVVVLHDVAYNHVWQSKEGICTTLLFNSVTGEKYWPTDEERVAAAASIAAFQVTKDTKKYVMDVVRTLMLVWNYIPDDQELAMYRALYSKYYDEEFLLWYDRAVKANQITEKIVLNKRKHLSLYRRLRRVARDIVKGYD